MTQPNTPTQTTKRSYRSEEQWRQLINAFEASNLSVDEYCAQNNLKYTTFCKWRQRLKPVQGSHQTPPSFIELTDVAKAPPVNQSAWDIELELGSGTFLRLRRG